MKTFNAWSVYIAAGILGALSGRGAVVAPENLPAPVVTSRSADARVWRHVRAETLPDGRTVLRSNVVVEMASGMHYFDGEWKESRDEIDIVPNGAAFTKAPHKVQLSGSTAGRLAITTPDNKTIRSSVLGLAFTDAAGQSTMFAPIRDVDGMLFPPNQVVYANAFSGGIVADVGVVSTRAGVEADVILRTRLPSPRDCNPNLDPDSCFLEVWHDFDAPEPDRAQGVAGDEAIGWGAMRLGRGGAFALDAPLSRMSAVPVKKAWLHDAATGRNFLVERVPYRAIENELLRLPPMQAALAPPNNGAIQGKGETRLALLRKTTPPKNSTPKPLQMALDTKIFDRGKGLVLDWIKKQLAGMEARGQ